MKRKRKREGKRKKKRKKREEPRKVRKFFDFWYGSLVFVWN